MAIASTSEKPTRRRSTARQRSEWLTAYLFILPATVLIAIFGLFPIIYAVYMSVHNWRIRRGAFIGLANYERTLGDWWGALAFFGGLILIIVAHWLWTSAFTGNRQGSPSIVKAFGALVLIGAGVSISLGWNLMMDAGNRAFLNGLIRTVYYGFGSVPIQIGLALVIASLLFQKIRGQEFFRMLYFLPYVTPAVAGAAIFRSIFNAREERLANQVLMLFGLEPQRWVTETRPVTQLIFGIWTYTGYNAVIFLAGLGGISPELYEAASIDGASKPQQFRFITVPLLSPVTFYLTVLGFIGTFQAFTHLFVLRDPQTRDAIDTASIVIFDTFYRRNDFSTAAAQSVILFAIILILTLMQNRFFGKRAFGG